MKQTHLTFDELIEIGLILNNLTPEQKETIFKQIDRLNNRVRSLESVISNIQYSFERV